MNSKPVRSISAPTPENILAAAQSLRAGNLVAFATETVYGLGANALDARAVARIFEAKGRPATNPLIVHTADHDAARRIAADWPPQAEILARAFWPGPLTLVLKRGSAIPDIITAGLSSVGMRVPQHPVALALLREARVPIAAPSANRSESLSPTRAEHVLHSLGDFLDAGRDMILDGGSCAIGIESSVLDLTQSPPALLRPGAIARAQIEALIGPISVPINVPEAHSKNSTEPENPNTPRPSPGMMARHYAPRARAVRFESRQQLQAALAATLAATLEAALAATPSHKYPWRLGIVVLEDLEPSQLGEEVRVLGNRAREYASRLYAALHELDEANCEEIWIEMPPEREQWRAVRDRLKRATVAAYSPFQMN